MLELRRLAQPLLDHPPLEPTPVEELQARTRRRRRRRLLASIVASVTIIVLVVTVVAVTRPATVVTVGPTGHVFASRATIAVGEATDIAVGADGVWVPGRGVVRRIDAHTNAIDRTVAVPGGGVVRSVIDAYGSVWVIDSGTGDLTRIDVRTGHVTATIPVGGAPSSIIAMGGRIWMVVARQGDEVGVVLDPATNRVVTSRPSHTDVLAQAADRDALYFVWQTGIERYEPNTRRSQTVPIDPTSTSTDYAVDLALDGTTLFVLMQSGRVIAYDALTLRRVRAGPPITGAAKLAASAGSVWVLVGHRNSSASGRLWRLDAYSLAFQGTPIQVSSPLTITAGAGALWVAAGSPATLTHLTFRPRHGRASLSRARLRSNT